MNSKNTLKNITLKITVLLTIFAISIFTYVFIEAYKANLINQKISNKKEVLGTEDSITISAVLPYYISIVVEPEKRIPNTNNNSLEVNVKIKQHGSSITKLNETLTTNSSGYVEFPAVDPSSFNAGNYDLYIKGLSHLTRKYQNITIGPVAINDLNLTSTKLLAGDSNPIADDYINSMDISYILKNFGSTDLRSDLNRDGIVDELDVNILITNLYKVGEK